MGRRWGPNRGPSALNGRPFALKERDKAAQDKQSAVLGPRNDPHRQCPESGMTNTFSECHATEPNISPDTIGSCPALSGRWDVLTIQTRTALALVLGCHVRPRQGR